MTEDFKIIRAGHPVLRQKTEEIKDPTSPDVHAVIALMHSIIQQLGPKKVAGLAAPQIGVSLRVFLYTPIKSREQVLNDDRPESEILFEAVINPVIEPVGEAKEIGWESCYSIPGLAFHLPRYNHIRMHYQTPEGAHKTIEAEGYEARILQHEYDHLDGRLEIDQLEDSSGFGYVEEVKEFMMDKSTGTKPRWSKKDEDKD